MVADTVQPCRSTTPSGEFREIRSDQECGRFEQWSEMSGVSNLVYLLFLCSSSYNPVLTRFPIRTAVIVMAHHGPPWPTMALHLRCQRHIVPPDLVHIQRSIRCCTYNQGSRMAHDGFGGPMTRDHVRIVRKSGGPSNFQLLLHSLYDVSISLWSSFQIHL